jgi:hypothetical protein
VFRVGVLRLVAGLGIDAVGGPPHCDFVDEVGARVASRRCPDRLGVTLAGVMLNLGGEVGDQSGSLCQVGPPDGMGMERFWNAGKPEERTWVGRGKRWEAPVEDGGHIARGSEVASGGGCHHVADWVLSSFGRQREQVGSQGWPGGFGGESGDVAVGLVELCDGLGSDKLFGRDVGAVGVALHRLEKPGRRVVELTQHGAGRGRSFIAGNDLLQRLSRRAR